MKVTVEIIEGVNVTVEGNVVKVSNGAINLSREFPHRALSIKVNNSAVDIENLLPNAKSRALVGTFRSHITNMIKGTQEPFVYKLKVCSLHFPMSVKISGNEITVQNFLGGKQAKKAKFPSTVKVSIEGELITVQCPDKELAGMVSSKIEQLTRVRNKDRRVFQDGIYMTEKAGKKIE
jgi:large subunit ribosomal protein L6